MVGLWDSRLQIHCPALARSGIARKVLSFLTDTMSQDYLVGCKEWNYDINPLRVFWQLLDLGKATAFPSWGGVINNLRNVKYLSRVRWNCISTEVQKVYLFDLRSTIPGWQCTGTCMKYAYQQVCTISSNLKNILLDDELKPHLSDCKIADLCPLGSDHQVYVSNSQSKVLGRTLFINV